MKNGFDQLSALTHAQMEAAIARISRLAEKEAALRNEISALSQDKNTRIDSQAARLLGADFVWRAYVEKRIKEKNIELAQILAQKALLQKKAQYAFGRNQAAQALASNNTAEIKKTKKDKEEETLEMIRLRAAWQTKREAG